MIKEVLVGTSVNAGGNCGDGTEKKVAEKGQGYQKGQKKRRVQAKVHGRGDGERS